MERRAQADHWRLGDIGTAIRSRVPARSVHHREAFIMQYPQHGPRQHSNLCLAYNDVGKCAHPINQRSWVERTTYATSLGLRLVAPTEWLSWPPLFAAAREPLCGLAWRFVP